MGLGFVSKKQCDGRPNDARNKGKLCQVLIESKAMDGFEGGDDLCGCVVCVLCLLCILGKIRKSILTVQDASQRDIYPSTHHHAATLLHDDDALLGDSQV